jgi:nitric-oxide synthase
MVGAAAWSSQRLPGSAGLQPRGHSFGRAGCTITDHHTVSAQYIEFAQAERAMGRIPSADWSWNHMDMTDLRDVPNFYRSRIDGASLRVSRATEVRSRHSVRDERTMRRWRDWLRRHYD